MKKNERLWLGITFVLVLCLAIAQHFSLKWDKEISDTCKAQTGYTEHKKTGANWYCKSGEGHWQRMKEVSHDS